DVSIDPATTTTTVTASPVSPQPQGTSVTFTAAVTPATAAGTVQFFDGTTALGTPVTVTSGSATFTTPDLAVGDHPITATFTPADGNTTTSTSDPITYTVQQPPAQNTSVTLAVSPGGTAVEGTSETLTATVTPSGATGAVTFLDNGTALGSAVDVSGGVASTSVALPVGDHSLTATFASSDTSAFLDSPP